MATENETQEQLGLQAATIENLASRVFAARDCAHRAHWATSSFSAHVALDGFYTGVVGAVDEIVEVYQGTFGLIGPFEVETDGAGADVVSFLESEVEWIEDARDSIANGSRAVENLIDGLVAIYRRALYKLRNLM
jgi:DNA-binding ferritin-like protein